MKQVIVVIGAGSIGQTKGPDGAFITVSDFLMDGGVTAAYWFGELGVK